MDEYELKIRREIARIYMFSLHERHAKCFICGKRFMYNYYGMGLNERMERHYSTCHSIPLSFISLKEDKDGNS